MERILRLSAWFISYRLWSGDGGGHPLWHLQAGLGLCCWQDEGRSVQAESQSASLHLFPDTFLFKPVPSKVFVKLPLGQGLGKHCLLGFQVTRGVWVGPTVSRGPSSHACPPWKHILRPPGQTLPASHPLKFLCFLQIMPKVLVIPSCSSEAPSQGPLGAPWPGLGDG